jgi:tetratricopeptide (TPR) repeat protein
MAGKIFINYRRDDSIGMAGRLHDRLAQTFGRKNIFMDVDHIPVGSDFVTYLNNQVAECDVVLVVIGSHWVKAKDKSGQRRLHQVDDFVAIEIAAALGRGIRVIPILVDGARMPKASELPESLKPLVRRQAAEVRHAHFGQDAETLVARMNEAFGDAPLSTSEAEVLGAVKPAFRIPSRRTVVAAASAVAVLLLVGVGAFSWPHLSRTASPTKPRPPEETLVAHANPGKTETLVAQANPGATAPPVASNAAKQVDQRPVVAAPASPTVAKQESKVAVDADAIRKAQEAEQQRVASAKAEQERQAAAAVAAEAKRKTDEAEQQRLAALRAEEGRKRAEAEARARYTALVIQGDTANQAGQLDNAVAAFTEAIRLDPKNATAFYYRGQVYSRMQDSDRAITDFTEAVRLDRNYARAWCARGLAYSDKHDYSRAVADFTEAVRLDPQLTEAYRGRGNVYLDRQDQDRAIADFSEAIRLDRSYPRAWYARGLAYTDKRDYGRAIADFTEASRLDPRFASAVYERGKTRSLAGDRAAGEADIAAAKAIDPNVGRKPPQKTGSAPVGTAMEQRAKEFALAVETRWSKPNTEALAGLDALYEDEVMYYGKLTKKGTILKEKRAFAERWPDREYKPKEPISVSCRDSVCTVSGVVDFRTVDPVSKILSRGEASFEYQLVLSGPTVKISQENGQVLNKTRTAPEASRSKAD